MSDTRTQKIDNSIDRAAAGAIALHSAPGNMMTIAPRTMGELFEFAKLMSISGQCIPAIFRDKPGACLAIALQAFRTGADPFAVANKAYMVNDRVAYEAQYIHATINTSGALKKRLRPAYEGNGPHRKCTITAEILGEDEPFTYTSPEFGAIPIKNSPLWKNDPDQQLFYYASRAWARRHLPEVILGMDTGGDIEMAGQMRDVTPPPRPRRANAIIERTAGGESEPEPDIPLYELIDVDGETVTCTADLIEANLMAIFDHAQRRGDQAIEAALENNAIFEQGASPSLVREFETWRAYLQQHRTEPEPEPEPEPDPPKPPRRQRQSRQNPADGRRAGSLATVPPGGSPQAAGSIVPSREIPSYEVPLLQNADGSPAYRAWWIDRFMKNVRALKTADDVQRMIDANIETINGFYATLAAPTRIATQKQLDDIKAALA